MNQSNASVSDRLRARWRGMGGKLGMGFAAAGFFLIVVAWNGAAGLDYVQGQLPYLISGGVAGLGLIIIGSALLVVESNRRDRVALEQRLEELAASLRVASVNGNGHHPPAPTTTTTTTTSRRRRSEPVRAK